MDFGLNEEQEQLRQAVREFFEKETPVSFSRAMMDDPAGMTGKVWEEMAKLGWLGLTVPVEHGGSGLGALELVLVMEEAGEVVLPGPLMSTLALAVPAVVRIGTAQQQARLLPALATGARAALAMAEKAGRWDLDGVEARADAAGDGYRLSGTKLFVPDARSSEHLLVVARVATGAGVFVVPSSTAGVTVTPMTTVDATRKLDVIELDGVEVGADALLGARPLDSAELDELVDIQKLALAAELCGLADASVRMSVEYLQIREQFGRALASFQALQHKLADMKVALENARSLTYYAAWAMDTGAEDRHLACAMAKAYAGEHCVEVVADAIQAHGGIGFTWEHDLHLYLKRARADAVTCGDPAENRELVAGLLQI